MFSPVEVTPALLREWGMPDPGDSKNARGRVIVVGGSLVSPGAVRLAGEAALRVGAGKLGVAVPAAVADVLRAAVPEAGVYELPAARGAGVDESLAHELDAADAVLIGPGLDDPDEAIDRLRAIAAFDLPRLIVDAFGLAALDGVARSDLPDELILNANLDETAILLGRDLGDDLTTDLSDIAERRAAVVNCYGTVVTPDGSAWTVPAGGPGLGTSGSGDVLAGAITGFAARGVPAAQAAVWGAWAHARAGDALTERVGLGLLAREIPAELAVALAKVLPAP